jgi:hypothetical protein
MTIMRSTRRGLVALAAVIVAAAFGRPASAQFTVPSDGSDGVLNVTTGDVEIDLSLAATGSWDTYSNGNGIYDPEQWIVVFKYQSINIAPGRTVRFKNHPKNPPVVWLVQGEVRIDGALSLIGRRDWVYPPFSAGGPGGFRGGRRVDFYTPGFGPGAGLLNDQGLTQGQSYQNASCFPLIGGSGASAGGARAGGGGAILVAAMETITVNGWISVDGGDIFAGGGMIRLVAPSVVGPGRLLAQGWGSLDPQYFGRIRVEANIIDLSTPSIPAYTTGTLGAQLRFLRDEQTPSARIVSVDDALVPADPGTSFSPADAVATANRKPRVTIECRNVPDSSIVRVYFRSANQGVPHIVVNAAKASGNESQSTWLAIGDLGANEGYATVQARVILPAP